MDRLFHDANVLFSAAYREGSGLMRLWSLSDVELLTSAYALEEARRNLADDEPQTRLADLAKSITVVDEAPTALALSVGLNLPEKDTPVLLAALNAAATHLLTGDKTHFGRYFGKKIAGILILRPADYLRGRS
ncbi:MAG: PIN domain-containing protein [Planctomycetota bacterium]